MLITQLAWGFVLLYLFFAAVYISLGDSSHSCSTHGDLRLVGGRVPSEGRVEVCFSGAWGTVCNNNNYWDERDVQVVCRQLGYNSIPTGYDISYFYPGTNSIILASVQCTSTEMRLVDCSYNSYTSHCSHSYDIAVRCHDVCSVSGDLRLVGGRASSEGRVEVCVNGVWGTVCDDSWDTRDTQVVCQQLGYHDGTVSSYPGAGTGPILLDDVHCRGSEQRLINCRHTTSHNCGHSEDIAVNCTCTDYELRLDNRSFSGSVEFCLSYNWYNAAINSASSVSVRNMGYTRLRVQWAPLVDTRISISAYEVSCRLVSSDISLQTETNKLLSKSVTPHSRVIILYGAWPLSTYDCCVRAAVKNTLSIPICATGRVLSSPPPPQDLSVTVLSARQVLVQWRPHTSVVITGLALTYRVSVSGQTNATPNTSILQDSLSPRSSYTFSVWACFSAINDYCARYNSVSMTKEMPEDAPSAMPLGLSGVALSATAIRLSWSPPPAGSQNGVIIDYEARFVSVGGERIIHTRSQTVTMFDLNPNQQYSCFVSAYTRAGKGPSAEYSLKTREGTPLAPRFTATRFTATEISVDIEPLILPEERRGEITSYHVLWKQRPQNTLNCGEFARSQNTSRSGLQTSFTLLNLDPGQEYCVTVSAETSAGVGDQSTTNIVEFYANTHFQILFTASTTCDKVVQEVPGGEKEELETAISDALSLRCRCSFSQNYIALGQLTCGSLTTVVVSFQGRLVSTQDISSVDLLFHLKEWLLIDPVIDMGGIKLQVLKKVLKNPTNYYTEFIGATTTSVLLALTVLISTTIVVTVCVKLSAIQKRLVLKEHKAVSLQLRINYLEDSGEEYVPTSDEEEDEEEKQKNEENDSTSSCGSTNGVSMPPPLPHRSVSEKEEKEKSDISSPCGGATSPPPLPPRILMGEESSTDDEDNSTILRQGTGNVRLEVSRELHDILQRIGNQPQSKSDATDEDSSDDDTFLRQGPGDVRLEVSRELHNMLQSVGERRDKYSTDKKASEPPIEAFPPASSVRTHLSQWRSEPREEENETMMRYYQQSSQHIYQPLLPRRLETASESGQDGDYQTLKR